MAFTGVLCRRFRINLCSFTRLELITHPAENVKHLSPRSTEKRTKSFFETVAAVRCTSGVIILSVKAVDSASPYNNDKVGVYEIIDFQVGILCPPSDDFNIRQPCGMLGKLCIFFASYYHNTDPAQQKSGRLFPVRRWGNHLQQRSLRG